MKRIISSLLAVLMLISVTFFQGYAEATNSSIIMAPTGRTEAGLSTIAPSAAFFDSDLLIGVWEGSCVFRESDGKDYERIMTLTILDYDSETFTGVFDYLIPDYRGGLHGSYYCEGFLNESTGGFSFQGKYMLIDDGYYSHSSYSTYNGTLDIEQG